jgi:hypothetical protein
MYTKTTCPPQIVHVFCTEKSTILIRSHPGFRSKTRSNPPKCLKLTTAHHNSPQNPNSRFIHRKVVGPPLLTFVSPGKTLHPSHVLMDRILANPRAQSPRSPIPLVSTPELRPGHLRRPAHKNIRMVLALLVLHPFLVPVMPRPPARSKRLVGLRLRKSNHD